MAKAMKVATIGAWLKLWIVATIGAWLKLWIVATISTGCWLIRPATYLLVWLGAYTWCGHAEIIMCTSLIVEHFPKSTRFTPSIKVSTPMKQWYISNTHPLMSYCYWLDDYAKSSCDHTVHHVITLCIAPQQAVPPYHCMGVEHNTQIYISNIAGQELTEQDW